ncbi:alpha/beta fold hydrolase [Polymorphobacter fuscus]|uniref:Alpha/beta fold hydrolase n=1 Tax=Sandarakinorhabdus fusca TaxID=1439888 RepID=A0A7C9GMN7_9SPHN|nr:alpha/beta hydrolase [Polymorphobacter fuscus]KAB7648192.1 alpha/beta hydrolase [Polymorphobacter fuscus]MQT15693.1 alpha/beta fold hydrolase [Polymorphobacter fuscus]NJC08036.1 pimeloyl-ACP methyl ester carboxylesterase [Polymorphobacter fuscus]
MPATRRRWPRRLAIGAAVVVGVPVVLWLAFRVDDIPVATLRAKYGSPASQYVTLAPGTVIHLRDEGPRNGFPVVLLHGSNASLHTWEPWVARLQSRFRVITFDFPAHGLSGPVPSRDYSTQSYVAITEKVAAHLGLTRFALGGNSMGGGVAWRYAVAHPDQVAALILIDASGQPPQTRSTSVPLGFRLANTPVLREVAATVTPRSLIERSFKQSVAVQSIATPAMIDRYWELLRYPGNREATLDRFGGYNPAEPADALSRITAPTLILWGREDHFIPVESADWFARQMPGARLVILDEVGHLPMEEAPDRALAPVLALLDPLVGTDTPR